ncbi:RNA polymerase sigma factor [Paenibacillus faecalis]|uniref:RNA polymerase sigma factor n=1 Tax=Paenibacillus faecalis TaxID=2079532 RepID=UPI000D106963|nr:RNA polymerase sigma factor [Paenibacillus faecalis]
MTERELFDAYNKEVYRTCYYMLRNEQDAEDLCHDVFVTVFRQDWKSIEHVRAWMMRITMNHCLNLLRKNQTKREKQNQVQWLYEQNTTSVKNVDTIVLEKAESAEWDRLLKELPDKQRSVILLRYIGELTIAEISEILNIPEGTVKSRLHQALKVLRRKIERHNYNFGLKGEKQYGTS